MTDLIKHEPMNVTSQRVEKSMSILGWDMARTHLNTAIASGADRVGIQVAAINVGWVPEYKPPLSIKPAELVEEPVLTDSESRVLEVQKALALAEQSLIANVSNVSKFGMVGGLVYPMDQLIQLNLTPQQIIDDDAALHLIIYFVNESAGSFKRVPDEVFRSRGINKQNVIDDYQDNYKKLSGTWKMPSRGAVGDFASRINHSKK
jgi:hypothetical protein